MYIETSYPQAKGDNAILMSPTYKFTTSGEKCIELWYHAYGRDVGSLNIYKLEKGGLSGNVQLIYSTSNDQGNEWHILQTNFYAVANREFNILIEGIVGSGFTGDISIDDYEFKEKECQPIGWCDFEEDTCAWKNIETGANFEWARHRGNTQTVNTGPSTDHTLGTPFGTYLYFETSSPVLNKDNAIMVSPVFMGNTSRCFEFYYHMYGQGDATLNIRLKNSLDPLNKSIVVWTDKNNYGDKWVYGSISLVSNFSTSYTILLEAVSGPSAYGDIGLDDLKISEGLCPSIDMQCAFNCSNGQCLPSSKVCNFVYDCPNGEEELWCGYDQIDFESGLGKWMQSNNGLFKWSRLNPGLVNGFGPSIDHTNQSTSGYFLLLEPSTGLRNINAQLKSPILKDSYSVCEMNFWYQISGQNFGEIEVFSDVGSQRSRFLRIQEETFNLWKLARVYIGRYRSDFTIDIEGFKTSATNGYLAIDDIQFKSCDFPKVKNCTYSEVKCENNRCVSNLVLCDFTDDCGDLSDEKNSTCMAYPNRCDFESSLCEWVQDETDGYAWKRTSGYETLSNILPQRDHTTNTESGSYIYVETKNRQPASTSTLIGPSFDYSKSPSCRLRLFYYMYGNSVGKLTVYARNAVGGQFSQVWTKIGSVDQSWQRADIYLRPYFANTNIFQVIIQSSAANSTQQDGFIAIDDISFTPNCYPSNDPLPVISTTTTAPPCGFTGFRCSDGKCINQSQLCDFVRDCVNGEDENNCGACKFENDSCGWYDNSFGSHMWNRSQALDADLPSDVSTGTNQGYLISYATVPGAFSGITRLFSPKLAQTGSSCEFDFFYYKIDNVDNTVIFSLFLNDLVSDSTQRLWTTNENTVGWTQKRIGLHSRNSNFRLYFEATQLSQVESTKPKLAIDDTSFVNCQFTSNITCPSGIDANIFKCTNGACIPANLVCDFENDCGDSSDEISCAGYNRCDFEDSLDPLCDWNSDDDAELYWLRGTGRQFETTTNNYPAFGNQAPNF